MFRVKGLILLLLALFLLPAFSNNSDSNAYIRDLDNWGFCGKIVTLRTHHNNFKNHFLSADNDLKLRVTNNKDNSSEFLVHCFPNENRVALETYLHRYVVAENDARALNADRENLGNWEKFYVFTSNFTSGSAFGFRSHHRRFVVAESNLTVQANRTEMRNFETFILETVGDDDGSDQNDNNDDEIVEENFGHCNGQGGGGLRYAGHRALVGHTTDSSTQIYAYAKSGNQMSLQYKKANSNRDECTTVTMPQRVDRLNTSLVELKGLSANTSYVYDVIVNNKIAASGQFKTAPSSKNSQFQYAVFSCSRYQHDQTQVGFAKAYEFKPSIILTLGDNVYAHTVSRSNRLDIHHRQQRQIPHFANIIANTPTYAIWDDHDFGNNNSQGGPTVEHDARNESRKAFMDAWANPSYGENNQGIYYSFLWGGVEFFMIDGRFFKDKSKRIMVGNKQLDWLKLGLKSSNAIFKVIANGQTLNSSGEESWGYASNELQSLLNYIRDERIPGVIFHAGDVHSNRFVNHGLRRNYRVGYDIMEIISSGVGNRNNGQWTMISVDTRDPDKRKNFIKVEYFKQRDRSTARDESIKPNGTIGTEGITILGSQLGY